MNLNAKSAVITGSTSGIGLGIAKVFAENGVNILLNGFGEPSIIAKLQQEITEQFKVKVEYSSADMRDPKQIRLMIEQAEQNLGAVDILVNNAGIQHTDLIENFPDDKWNDIIAINLSSAFYAIKAVLPGMKQRNYGRIINIASAHGLVASVQKSAYVASKHGLIGLSKVTALENAKADITCNAICPGWVLTPLVQQQIEAKANLNGISVEQAKDQLLAEKEPSGRFTEPKHLGELAAFLCSEAASNITGSVFSADGGWTAQ